MPIPDAELARRCEEVFGTPLNETARGEIAAALEALAKTTRKMAETLDPAAEPGGQELLYRNGHRSGGGGR